MGSNVTIHELLKDTFLEAINELDKNYQGSSLTDVFITVDKESGEVAFYDDEENCVGKIVVFDWVDNANLNDGEVADLLRQVTIELDSEGRFASLDIYKPFSVSYANDNMEVIEELLTMSDDDEVLLEDDMVERLTRDFDDFVDQLLKD